MTNIDHDRTEELLRQASPRPVPSPADIAAARAAVHDEWQSVTGRRRTQRFVMRFALAASLVVAALVGFSLVRTPSPVPIQVAEVVMDFGPVYLSGDDSELRATSGQAELMAGQTVVTGDDAGLAINWGAGGSLRVDENTRLTLTGPDRVQLTSGRVYFDSISTLLQPGADDGNSARLLLETMHGVVRHVGTQYMADVSRDSLVVSVREGQVEIDGRFHQGRAREGQQVTMSGSQQPSILRIDPSGRQWHWVARRTPLADVDGKTLHEFLVWACRETGLRLQFEGNAEAVARNTVLRGKIDTEPAEALRLRLATTALDWRIEEGVIYITDETR
jgi:ferric-dicitrate binding protein FerR (iron transport regulator)